jgi:hypothetical protein
LWKYNLIDLRLVSGNYVGRFEAEQDHIELRSDSAQQGRDAGGVGCAYTQIRVIRLAVSGHEEDPAGALATILIQMRVGGNDGASVTGSAERTLAGLTCRILA